MAQDLRFAELGKARDIVAAKLRAEDLARARSLARAIKQVRSRAGPATIPRRSVEQRCAGRAGTTAARKFIRWLRSAHGQLFLQILVRGHHLPP